MNQSSLLCVLETVLRKASQWGDPHGARQVMFELGQDGPGSRAKGLWSREPYLSGRCESGQMEVIHASGASVRGDMASTGPWHLGGTDDRGLCRLQTQSVDRGVRKGAVRLGAGEVRGPACEGTCDMPATAVPREGRFEKQR